MGLFEHFPYTNFHDLNLDAILKRVKDAEAAAQESAEDAAASAAIAQGLDDQISAAVSAANTAASNASTALSTANTAASNASTALSTANTAASNASTALSTANTAASDASTAASSASAAATNAATSASSASTAATNAATSATAAESAATSAAASATSAGTAATNAAASATAAQTAQAAAQAAETRTGIVMYQAKINANDHSGDIQGVDTNAKVVEMFNRALAHTAVFCVWDVDHAHVMDPYLSGDYKPLTYSAKMISETQFVISLYYLGSSETSLADPHLRLIRYEIQGSISLADSCSLVRQDIYEIAATVTNGGN